MQESSAMNFKIAIVLLQLLTTSYASSDDFELACDSANPSAKTNVTCVCRRTVGNGIQWVLNGTQISECVFNDTCLPTPDGYTFLINVFAYKMTKIDYDYNDCTQINCRDLSNTSAQLMVVPSAINFDSSNPTPIAEPAFSHNNGMFSITTGCISGYMHVTCEWYTFNNGAQEEYTQGQSAFVMFNKSSCSNCNDDDNAKMTCGFYHIEASGNETKNVYFRVVVTHIPTNLKWEVNSTNVYTIKGNVDQVASTKKGFWKKLKEWLKEFYYIVIVSILVLLSFIAAIYLCLKKPGKVAIDFTSSSNSDETRSITVNWKSSCLDFRNLVYDLTYSKVIVNITKEMIPDWEELLNKQNYFKDFKQSGNATKKSDLKETKFEITNLSTGTYYKVGLVARSSRGKSVLCEKIFTTKHDTKKQAVDPKKVTSRAEDETEPKDNTSGLAEKQKPKKKNGNKKGKIEEQDASQNGIQNVGDNMKSAEKQKPKKKKGSKKWATNTDKQTKVEEQRSQGHQENEAGTSQDNLIQNDKSKIEETDASQNGIQNVEDNVKSEKQKPKKKKGSKKWATNTDKKTKVEEQRSQGQQENEAGTSQYNLIQNDNSKIDETDASQNGIQNIEDNEESANSDDWALTPVDGSNKHQNRANIECNMEGNKKTVV